MAGPFGENGLRAKAEVIAAEGFAAIERLDARIADLAERLSQLDYERDRGEIISRSVAATSVGAPVTELALAPEPGVIWEVYLMTAAVPNAAAARNVTFFLGGLGDMSRPLGTSQAVAAATADGLASFANVGPNSAMLPVNQGIYARGLALAVDERLILHVIARELLPVE